MAVADANEFSSSNAPAILFQNTQKVRAECLEGRRIICGKILRVLPDGLVIDSGYTGLLRPPLTDSWLIPGAVNAMRTPNLVESREPGSPCVGTIFLSDLPRSRGKKPKPFDYVILLAYPAGEHTYTSVGMVQKTVRRFSGALSAAMKYQIAERKWTAVQLNLPANTNGTIPKLLSQIGAFSDMTNLVPKNYLVPYDVNVPFWSDGAEKTRWAYIPPGEAVHFSPTNEWSFPPGTVFVKNFEIAIDETHPKIKRRLETRLLVCDDSGGAYGVTYKWRADNSDADLLETNLNEDIEIKTATGVRKQTWYYPSRADCLACHTANANLVLGVKTRQLNCNFSYPSRLAANLASPSSLKGGESRGEKANVSPHNLNQLIAWRNLGLFDTNFSDADAKKFRALAHPNDLSRSLEDRVRSYLDANCAQCHRPNGTVANFDARYDTPLAEQNIVNGRVLIDQRIDAARVIAPNDVWRSILLMRVDTTDGYLMPPLARNTVDERAVKMLREWIASLPGPRVLPPPKILPPGGNFSSPVQVSLRSEPKAKIFYTLDGTVPTTNDLPYQKPFTVSNPTIVRAKAFKDSCTKSVTSKGFFLFNQ
jgi:mono/diheme cytochrome c family protein